MLIDINKGNKIMKELLINCNLSDLKETKNNFFIGKVLFKNKVISTHIIDLILSLYN